MGISLDRKLLHRELWGDAGLGSIQSLYGSRAWVDNLDIENELHGHDGCVNALCWSRSGGLLATGSDDTQINIHTTYPTFSLNTTIDTGHTANIFSVKFMPGSSDRTLISAAGDSEVRIFDIEYAPVSTAASIPSPRVRSSRRLFRHRRGGVEPTVPAPLKSYSHHSYPHKVYRSHTDRVKRIVTESSPYLFLTCSEDGTVRQFDLRQPSEFYSRPAARRSPYGAVVLSLGAAEEDERNPPLISYRRHRIDLNTISCSPSQPHYIALGGAHVHCFLHDRRMLGRDKSLETGSPGAAGDDDALSAATKCVRRFEPKPKKGSPKNWRRNVHITACKISDANPNEVLVSWSADGAYLFDINRSPAPNEKGQGRDPWEPEEKSARMKSDREGKRKKRRVEKSSASSSDGGVPGQGMVKIAALVVDLRRELFGMNSSSLEEETTHASDLEWDQLESYKSTLAIADVALKRINDDIEKLDAKDLEHFDRNKWKQPSEITHQRNLRRTLARNRRRVRGFIRAAGCVARVLGGFVEGIGLGVGAFMRVAQNGNDNPGTRYRILQCVISYLEGGAEAIEEFAKQDLGDEEDEVLAVDIGRYLRDLELAAGEEPLRDVDTNEELFSSERSAVRAFRGVVELGEDENSLPARRFWGRKVARALLMREATEIDFKFVDSAFRGIEDEYDDDDDDEASDNESPHAYITDDEENEDYASADGEFDYVDDKAELEGHEPIWEHTKVYRGHCNVNTVKDINFYGLDDEYVVSGSDCGHLFIWDKKTAQLINILHGDDDTVNVATGHPYEPKLAVSGIDYTVKIFSPDSRAHAEFLGIDEREDGGDGSEDTDETSVGARRRASGSRKRMSDSYKITSQNQVSTESGLQEAVFTVSFEGRDMSFAEWIEVVMNGGGGGG